MTVRLLASLLAAAICVVATVGCESDPTVEPPKKEPVCAHGTVFSCYANGCNGHQFCNADGSKMSDCECDDDDDMHGGQAGSLASDHDAAVAADASDSEALTTPTSAH